MCINNSSHVCNLFFVGLEKCIETNKIYPEARFEIAGETSFGRTGAPAKSRKNRMEGKVVKDQFLDQSYAHFLL